MAVQDRLYTVEEFWEITQLPKNENKRLELIDGVIVEMASSSKINTILGVRLSRLLGTFVDSRALGFVTGADGGFQIGPRTTLIPDTAFISTERAGGIEGNVFAVAPDLA